MLDKIKSVLGIRKYLILTIIFSIVLFIVYWILTFMFTYKYSPAVYAQMNGTGFLIFSLVLNLILALLTAVNISVVIYKLNVRKTLSKTSVGKQGTASFGGTVAGVVSSGCPTCGALLPGLIGSSLGLGLLPFKGLEIKLLGIGILTLALYAGTKKIDKCEMCETPSKVKVV